jgi:hypothetical protein
MDRPPIRTYSKRTAPNTDRDSSSHKRRKIESESILPPPPRVIELPRLPPVPPISMDKTDKGSILDYFRPVRSCPGITSSDTFSEIDKIPSTPPSSPPVNANSIRSRRQLKRIWGQIDSETSGKAQIIEPMPTAASQAALEEVKPAIDALDDDKEVQQTEEGLQEATINLVNTRTSPRTQGKIIGFKLTNKTATRSKSAPTIQTTLNISAQPAFAECKICSIVYNPLHPNDVKLHSKRHAAVVKAKKQKS